MGSEADIINEVESQLEAGADSDGRGTDKNEKNSILQEQEEKIIIVVKNPEQESPQRIDFSGLKAQDDDGEQGPAQLRIRKGSLADQRDMEYLMQNQVNSDQAQVLVIRQKKYSLDETPVPEHIEAEAYNQTKKPRGKSTETSWTKKTILKGTTIKTANKRG